MRRLAGVTAALLVLLALLLAGPLFAVALGHASIQRDWRSAGHRPAGFAPEPAEHPEAIVQVYAARTVGWRGAFAVHSWLAAKPAGATGYTRYEVIGWYARYGGSAVSVSGARAPDAEWFGAKPLLLADLRGPAAAEVIAKLPAAVEAYPFAQTYSAWPGPNSNTFIAHLGRSLPALNLVMPPIAIGKDYLPFGEVFARTPSGTGYQASLGGVFGLAVGPDEGIELNLFGLVTGVDFKRPGIKVPGLGSLPGG